MWPAGTVGIGRPRRRHPLNGVGSFEEDGTDQAYCGGAYAKAESNSVNEQFSHRLGPLAVRADDDSY
jgi:hypothetical protein